MNVLITGGQGFLGQHLAQRLARSGYGVVLYDHSPGVTERAIDCSGAISQRDSGWANAVQGDINNLELLVETLRFYHVGVVVHLATLLTDECAQHPWRAAQVNCSGTAAVFEAAQSLGIGRVVFGSSVAVFGDQPGLSVGDNRPYDPPSVYGATKVFEECLASAMMKDNPDLELIGLRFGWIYGLGRVRGWTAIQEVIEGFALESAVVPYPDYSGPNDWTYVSDATEAIVRCLNSPRPDVVAYNVSGDFRPIQDAIRHLQQHFPKVRAEPYRAELPHDAWNFESDRITQQTGYRSLVKLEEGLDLAVNDIRRSHGLMPVD